MPEELLNDLNIKGFLRLRMEDNKNENIINHFEQGIEFIEESLNSDPKSRILIEQSSFIKILDGCKLR